MARPREGAEASSFRLNGGRYRLKGSLGRGAHCVVWRCQLCPVENIKATDDRPQWIALKVHIGGTDGGRQARREADALCTLKHSEGLFPRLLGTVTFNGRQCLALPLHGPDLYALQKARGRRPFPFEFVVGAAHQLLSALRLLAASQLVHADVKPQNVVLTSPQATLDGLVLDGGTRMTLIDLGSCLSLETRGRSRKMPPTPFGGSALSARRVPPGAQAAPAVCG